MASFMSLSLKTGRLIFIWSLDSLQHWWLQFECLGPPDLSDLDDTDEEADTELWSLSNLQSGEGESDGGGAAHRSQSWPHCNAQPCSWYDALGLCLGTSNCSAAVGSLTPCKDSSWLWNLNGGDTGGIEWGHLGPLGSMHCSVMAWVINCQPSPKVTTLALSLACLPTQLMAPDSMNMASHP